MARVRIPTPDDFGFLPVVYSHGWFQCPPFYWDPKSEVLARVLRGEDGLPVLVRLCEPSRGKLEMTVEVDGRLGSPARQQLIGQVRRILQLDRDLSAFHRFCAQHRQLASLPVLGAGRLLRCPTLWEELVKAICGTNVAWPQAVRMISRVAELGEPVGECRAWPTPEHVVAAGEARLRERCRLGYRAPYVVDLASRVSERRLDLGAAERGELDGNELRNWFLSVRGIGPATADYLMILHGDTGRLSVDSAVYAYTAERYFGGRRPSAGEIERLYERFGEWKALAYWFEFLQEVWWEPAGFDFRRARGTSG